MIPLLESTVAPVMSRTRTYLEPFVKVILFAPLNVKVFNCKVVPDNVEASKSSEVASAEPVGTLSVPNAVAWVSAYITAWIFPVGSPVLRI
jgi:hypothetical protein